MLLGVGLDGPLAWKPNVYVAPGARLVCQLGGVIVQLLPLAAKVALQPLARVTPLGTVHFTAQLLSVPVPLFFTVTLAVKPCAQELWIA